MGDTVHFLKFGEAVAKGARFRLVMESLRRYLLYNIQILHLALCE